MLTDVNGMDTSASLTHSKYLTLVSSDLKVFEIDKENVKFLGKAPGHIEIRISFSEATGIVQAIVQ